MRKRLTETAIVAAPMALLSRGAPKNPRELAWYSSFASLRSTSAFMTKGLGSGSPKCGPKVYSVITVVSPPTARAWSGPTRRS